MLLINKMCLYFHTLKHLKFIQFANRVKRKLVKIDVEVKDIASVRIPSETWNYFELQSSSYIKHYRYRFLNQSGDIGNWNDINQSKLWLYNLHYFNDLNAFESNERKIHHEALILKWIDENPPLSGNGWEPYPQSLRIVNWIKFFLSKGEPSQKMIDSLYQQTYVLSQNLEYHLLGNHLFANAKALIFAGCYFEGEVAKQWLDKGLAILDKELPEQILNDGANFELSPMYHNIILSDLLDLVNISQTYRLKCFEERVGIWEDFVNIMLDFSNGMTHPDGEVSFFNDSAMGIAPKYSTLYNYALSLNIKNNKDEELENKLGYTIKRFKESGYISVESKVAKFILDICNIGPDYIPGHGHADTLSFEASFYGQRVFVNSGTSLYGITQERQRQRETASHNTVEVNGLDSSEVWGGFRVAQRAYPNLCDLNSENDNLIISGIHDGYSRLKHKVFHKRTWTIGSSTVTIKDTLIGSYNSAKAYLYIHPNISVKEDDGRVILELPTKELLFVSSDSHILVENSTWHPEFGLTLDNKRLVFDILGSNICVDIDF
ncbi:heparinase II/III family protein [Vibrio sp. 10N.222.54.B12]|uniref:heparinase II/III family protein n=1 Tax=Vibrio sp. 10N.222.54.B12 TaxID=3229636 RepID=UPI00354FD62D